MAESQVGDQPNRRASRGVATTPEVAPLCWGQQWSWRQQQLPVDRRPDSLLLSRAIDVPAGLRVSDVRSAVQLVAARHATLRSTYVVGDDETPQQRVWSPDAECYEFEQFDDEAAGRAWLRMPLDIQSGWPIRVAVAATGSEVRALGITTHHIAADLHGSSVLRDELQTVADALAQGTAPVLPAPGRQPQDIASFEQSPAGVATHDRSVEYWLRHHEALSRVLDSFGARGAEDSNVMNVARATSHVAVTPLTARASRLNSVAAVVASIYCVLTRNLGLANFPLAMLVANRHLAGVKRSVCSLAQSGLVSLPVSEPQGIEPLLAVAANGVLSALRHGHYDGDQLADRIGSLGCHSPDMTAYPTLNIVLDEETVPDGGLGPDAETSASGSITVEVAQLQSSCVGIGFRVGMNPPRLSIEVRAGAHLLSADECEMMAIDVIRPIIGDTGAQR